MPLTQAQIQTAQAAQYAAAHDQGQPVRVVAGPGTGKSSAIEEWVRWLLAQGVQPAAIHAVSFTRASALDLRQRVHAYCAQNGQPTATQVRVTTLHSLAWPLRYRTQNAGVSPSRSRQRGPHGRTRSRRGSSVRSAANAWITSSSQARSISSGSWLGISSTTTGRAATSHWRAMLQTPGQRKVPNSAG